MAVPLPYLLELMRLIASVRVGACMQTRTGPKTSVWEMSMEGVTSVMMVGPR